jgi:hypothetical protein
MPSLEQSAPWVPRRAHWSWHARGAHPCPRLAIDVFPPYTIIARPRRMACSLAAAALPLRRTHRMRGQPVVHRTRPPPASRVHAAASPCGASTPQGMPAAWDATAHIPLTYVNAIARTQCSMRSSTCPLALQLRSHCAALARPGSPSASPDGRCLLPPEHTHRPSVLGDCHSCLQRAPLQCESPLRTPGLLRT